MAPPAARAASSARRSTSAFRSFSTVSGSSRMACLEAGTSAVEHRVEISHLAPTPVGAKVKAEAVLEAVEGRRLVFRISVSDDRGLVAAGRFTRVIVSTEQFLEKAGAVD